MLSPKMNKLTFRFRVISEHLWFGFYFKWVCNFKNVLAEVPRLLIYPDLLQRPTNAQYILMRPWKVHSTFWTVSMLIHLPFSPFLYHLCSLSNLSKMCLWITIPLLGCLGVMGSRSQGGHGQSHLEVPEAWTLYRLEVTCKVNICKQMYSQKDGLT